jgi:alkylation response protein AidB-like acyl-CoA dehydrogenase
MAVVETPDDVGLAVRSWLADNWDPTLALIDWRRRLAHSRWAAPSWPVEWQGMGLASWADDIVASEIVAAGAVGVPLGAGMGLAAPTILAHGSDRVKSLLLGRILTGEDGWCQLFSEPGNGSDLAGLTTSAVRDGDEWVVNGQKLWTTSAHLADLGLLLARTDWDVPKHRGITCFALPMHQPGVEARPLRQMNGHSSFNEVFLTDARVPATNMIGEPGEGWRAALTTLAHERRYGAVRRRDFGASPPTDRAIVEAAAEAEEYFRVYEWYPQRAGRADLLQSRVEATHTSRDPIVRQAVAGVLSMQTIQQWTARRAAAARAQGRSPGAEGSIGKLGMSLVARAAANAHSMIGGASGMLAADDTSMTATIHEVLISVPAQSIAGGTDEIQHNILGEQMLGLPREPSVDRDVPFREIRSGGRQQFA